MKKLLKKILLIMPLLLLSILALQIPGTALADVNHCGPIAANETWAAADNVHVICSSDVTVSAGVTLTIEEGAIVKAQTDGSLIVDGKLVANGTAGNPIYFTSYKDDSVGGDTNGDGPSVGAVQDWGRIRFNSGSDDTSSIQHATIKFSGNDGPYSYNVFGAIELVNASPSLEDIIFIDNYINGIQISAATLETDTWDNSDIVYNVRQDTTVPVNNMLSIAPGVIVKFTLDVSLFVNGGLQVAGTAQNNVIFTSYRDDDSGGDTNNNGYTTGQAQDWGHIQFNDSSDDASSINFLTIKFSGNDGPYSYNIFGAISLDNASPILNDILFESNVYNGVEIQGGSWASDIWDNQGIWHYVTGNITIPDGNTLEITDTMRISFLADATIQNTASMIIHEGSVIKFSFDDSLYVNGKLSVLGTSGAPIYMTSYRDDSVGGDMNNDGASNGATQDWGHIRFSSESDDTSEIRYTTIRYSGNDGPYSNNVFGAIRLENASPVLENINFQYNYINGASVATGIWQSDTWDNSDVVYYLRGDVTVPEDNTLGISPGVMIKLVPDASLFINGKLMANGTPSDHIIFTSYRDDDTGGDTNNNGFTTGAVQDWGHIRFNDSSDDLSEMSHVTIRYSGNDGPYSNNVFGAIALDNASPVINNITFDSNYYNGAEVFGGAWSTDTWDNTDINYYVTGDLQVATNNTLTVAENMRVNFRADVNVVSDSTLVFEAGAIAKFDFDDSLFVNGKLLIQGTAGNPVTFTSYRDDSIGGDSNGDGASTGFVEDWGHIRFTSTSDSSSQIDHLVIRFAGNDGYSNNDYGAVRFENASATIRNSVFTKNYRGIETIGTSNPSLTCNSIYENVGYGVYNDTPANPVDAINHWWGSASGPTHASNPGGTGQTVSDGVNYSPWGTQSCESVVTGSIYLPFIHK